jgi:NADPH-dependent ferric siderophore reductase
LARTRHSFTASHTERLTEHMVRVHLGGSGFETFEPSEFTDSYVKLIFDRPDGEVVRTYTVRAVDPAAKTIAIDFVLHGDQGVAGPWAAAAQPGDAIGLFGPGGGYAPKAEADWHLFAGDISALPAISAACAALPTSAVGRVFIEVAGPGDELDFARPEGVALTWVQNTGSTPGKALAEAVRAEPWLDGVAHVFIHGEAEAVMHDLRPYIRKERGVPAEWASISGYWRRGRTEEGFRQWKRDLAESESAS